MAQELLKSLTLYSENQEVVASLAAAPLKEETAKMQNAELYLDASKVRSGIYYLHIDLGGVVTKERVALE